MENQTTEQRPESEQQFKFRQSVISHSIKPCLRTPEESAQRLQQQLANIRLVSRLSCPFHLDCYALAKVTEEEWLVKTIKPTSDLGSYLRKDVPLKLRLSIICNLLDALLVLEELHLVCLRVIPAYIQICVQDGEPIVKLPIHELWRMSHGNNDLLANSLEAYMAGHGSELPSMPPQLQRKPTAIFMKQTLLWTLSLTILEVVWMHEPIKIDFATKGTKYCLEQCNIESAKYEPATKKNKFTNEEACLKLVLQNLSFDPQKRISSLTQLKRAFSAAFYEDGTVSAQPLDQKLLRQFKQKFEESQLAINHHHAVSSESFKFSLLDEELSSKLASHFQTCKKPLAKPQPFKPFYKASASGFSSRHFHQKCDTVRHILVVFQTTTKHKFCGYSPVAFDLNSLEGLFGSYLSDNSLDSFLYANDEFFILKDRSKAIGNAPNHGPIFGETDIVTVDRNLANISRLKSYHPKGAASKTKLVPHETFILEEYEAYSVCFHQPQ